jgi:hypothetical protein
MDHLHSVAHAQPHTVGWAIGSRWNFLLSIVNKDLVNSGVKVVSCSHRTMPFHYTISMICMSKPDDSPP